MYICALRVMVVHMVVYDCVFKYAFFLNEICIKTDIRVFEVIRIWLCIYRKTVSIWAEQQSKVYH